MGKLVISCYDATARIYDVIVIRKAEIKEPAIREMLFKNLMAIWFTVGCMIKALDYTTEDISEALKKMSVTRE